MGYFSNYTVNMEQCNNLLTFNSFDNLFEFVDGDDHKCDSTVDVQKNYETDFEFVERILNLYEIENISKVKFKSKLERKAVLKAINIIISIKYKIQNSLV